MIRRWLLPLAFLAVTASPGLAQFAILGENKVQYRQLRLAGAQGAAH